MPDISATDESRIGKSIKSRVLGMVSVVVAALDEGPDGEGLGGAADGADAGDAPAGLLEEVEDVDGAALGLEVVLVLLPLRVQLVDELPVDLPTC